MLRYTEANQSFMTFFLLFLVVTIP